MICIHLKTGVEMTTGVYILQVMDMVWHNYSVKGQTKSTPNQ